MKRVYVALDRPDLDGAIELARLLSDSAAGFKVGLELLMAHGPTAVTEVARVGLPVFVDAKLHDIPNTVLGASRRIRDAGGTWLTVHATGGSSAMAAAVEGMGELDLGGVLAVTVLTSLSERDLDAAWLPESPTRWAVHLAGLASRAGAAGAVCSPLEVDVVRSAAAELLLFTPGIRRDEDGSDDQSRTATPQEALDRGADFLVIGRPVTASADPLTALEQIDESLRGHP